MKFLCLILIALTLLLSSSPCCADDECCNETGKECSENSTKNHHSEEPSTSCSPFMVCGSCSGFVVLPTYTDLNPEPVIADSQNTPYIQLYPGNYNLKFWQPPKIS